MNAIDAAAPQSLETLIERAGWAVAAMARSMLGGTYGKRVWLLCGPGNNGADGRAAASVMTRWGVRCRVIPVGADAMAPVPADRTPEPDLVIDAAFGTGLSRPFDPPPLPNVEVLAVDIPSGVDGMTGELIGSPLRATRTITFGAYKPGLLFGSGADLSGQVTVATLGLDCSDVSTHLLQPDDLERWPQRPTGAHKWNAAVRVVGGAAGMSGATALVCSGAFAAGASYLDVLGEGAALPVEAVQSARRVSWGHDVVDLAERFGAVVIGPGMDRQGDDSLGLRAALTVDRPLVLDGGALSQLDPIQSAIAGRSRPTVLTPHDGEFERLMGGRPGTDRIQAAREGAARFDCVFLLKGPTTVVANPSGAVRLVDAGDQRLATAGSGDVLSGVIAAGLAQGLDPMDAASLGSLLHGQAGSLGRRTLTASDLPGLIGEVLDSIDGSYR